MADSVLATDSMTAGGSGHINSSSSNIPPGVVVLVDPASGYRAYIVATAHVSAKAGADAQRVLESVRPDFCAVELDKKRLEHVKDVMSSDENKSLPHTPWKVVSALIQRKTSPVAIFIGLHEAFVSTILGVPYGVDMRMALETADDLGIRVMPIDRPLKVTMARVFAQARTLGPPGRRSWPPHRRLEQQQQDGGTGLGEKQEGELLGGDTDKLSGAEDKKRQRRGPPMSDRQRQQRALVLNTVLNTARAAGCSSPESVVDSFAAVMQSAMHDEDMPLDDLRSVRDCGTKIVELFRQRAAAKARVGVAQGGLSNDDNGAGGVDEATVEAARSGEADPSREVMADAFGGNMPPALTSERDLILAQNLRRLTSKGTTVAVVGAGHLPGICARWRDALTPQAVAEARSYSTMPGGRRGPPFLRSSSPPSAPSPPVSGEEGLDVVPVEGMGMGEEDRRKGWHFPPLGPMLVGAGFAGLCIYRPRTAAVMTLGFGVVAGAGVYTAASAVARFGKAARRLEAASKLLEARGDEFAFST